MICTHHHENARRRLTILMLGSAALACEPSDQQPAPQAVPSAPLSDTASFEKARLIRNDATALEQAPLFVLQEDLRLGDLNDAGANEFFRVVDVDEGPDGSIYVLDTGNAVVSIFDRSGRRVRTFGRKGEGPGEFRNAYSIAVTADTLLVFDRLVHIFTASGDFLSSRPIRVMRGSSPDRLARVGPLQRTPRGWMVGYLHQPVYASADAPGTRGGPYRDTTAVRRYDPSKDTLGGALVRVPGRETYLLGALGFLRVPFFAPSPVVSIAPDGKVFVTNGDEYRIDVYDADGTPAARILGEVERIPVTNTDFDESMKLELAGYEGRPREGETAKVLDMLEKDYPSLPRAKFRPVPGRMHISPNGELLVERLDLDDEPFVNGDDTAWDMFDAAGRITGRLILPPRTTPYRWSGDYLYAAQRDQLDVQSVVRFRIARSDAR